MKRYNLFGWKLRNNLTIPSGIITTSADLIEKFMPRLAYAVTKTTTLEEREGNKEIIFCKAGPDLPFDPEQLERSFQNAVGLRNKGALKTREDLSRIKKGDYDKLVCSIGGKDEAEILEVARILEPVANAFEINLSCPHSPGFGTDVGTDADAVALIVKALKGRTKKPVFPKLAPNIETIGRIAKAAMEAGADAISAVNTLGPFESDYLSNVRGGLSGAALKDRGIMCVAEIDKATEGKIPLIVSGGISCIDDILEYEKAGRNIRVFGIGSLFTGMNTSEVINCLSDFRNDYENETKFTLRYKYRSYKMDYDYCGIKKVIKLTDDLKVFIFDMPIDAAPGQYVFLSIGRNEKPFSIADNKPLTIAVRKRGDFTSQLFSLGEHNVVGIRGAYGRIRDYELGGDICLIGGGTGAAPINFFAKKRGKNADIFVGFTKKEQMIFYSEMEKRARKLNVSVDNGKPGRICHDLEEHLKKTNYDCFVICGPEKMMAETIEIIQKHNLGAYTLVLTEQYMGCGVGICGRCSLNGLRTCVDGPALLLDELGPDFRSFKKDKYGMRVAI